MRNIPMFVTENGAATLILDQIPYRNCAYVQLLECADPEALLQECCDFCRAAGARKVYAWGDPVVEEYPVYTSVLLFRGSREKLLETQFSAQPVKEEELERWREIYNDKMSEVAGAAYMTIQRAQQYCKDRTGFMVRDPEGDLCGIGIVEQNKVGAVISLYRGMGAEILSALCTHLSTDQIYLEAASTNERAIRLYLHQGMECIQELSQLHEII